MTCGNTLTLSGLSVYCITGSTACFSRIQWNSNADVTCQCELHSTWSGLTSCRSTCRSTCRPTSCRSTCRPIWQARLPTVICLLNQGKMWIYMPAAVNGVKWQLCTRESSDYRKMAPILSWVPFLRTGIHATNPHGYEIKNSSKKKRWKIRWPALHSSRKFCRTTASVKQSAMFSLWFWPSIFFPLKAC